MHLPYWFPLLPIGSQWFLAIPQHIAGRSPRLGRSAGGAAGSGPRGLLPGGGGHRFALRLRSGRPDLGALAEDMERMVGESVLLRFPDGVYMYYVS